MERGRDPHVVGQSDRRGDFQRRLAWCARRAPFRAEHPAAAQIARLAGTLPQGGAARLERLRGFGASVGGPLTCLCSRIICDDGEPAILVVATERAGPDLALPDRGAPAARRFRAPAAIFAADGELIEASAAARKRLGVQARSDRARRGEARARGNSQRRRRRRNRRRPRQSCCRLGAGRDHGAAFDPSNRPPFRQPSPAICARYRRAPEDPDQPRRRRIRPG